MTGIMSTAARTKAIDALRKAALRVAQEIESGSLKPENLARSYPQLRRLWFAFPETRADVNVPPVKEISAAMAKADAIDLFEKRDRVSKANRWMKNQRDFLDG